MRSRLVLLTCQMISLGLMIAFLVVPASALFLNRYGANGLPYAYLAVAVSGVVVTAVIRRAQSRLSVAAVAVAVLSVYLVLVAAAWLILTVGGGVWVTFPLLVLFPLSIPIGFLIVGAQAGRLLDVRQMKAHFPRVVAGFSVGFGLGGLLSAWLAPILGGPAQLLVLAVVATMIMIVLVTVNAGRHPEMLRTRPEPRPPVASRVDPNRAAILRNPLLLTIFGYQLLSSAVGQLFDYMVWERAAAHYPDAVGLTRFMGLFGMTINVVTILFVAIFAGRLLTRFGVRLGLAANPAGVVVLSIAAVVTGFVGGIAGVVFFVVVCAGQVVDIALTDGMTRTGISATYQALPMELRLRAQTTIEGAGVPLALGLVGVLLLICHALSLGVLVVAGVTLVLSVLWLLLARRAFREYGTSLRAAVTSRPWDPQPISIADAASEAAVRRLLESPDPVDRGVGLRALADADDPRLKGQVSTLLADPNPAWQALGRDFAVRGGIVGLTPAAMGGALDLEWSTDPDVGAIPARVPIDVGVIGDELTLLLDDPDPMVRVAASAMQVDTLDGTGERALDIWRRALRSEGELTGRALRGAAASPSKRFLPDLLELAATDAPPPELSEALSAHADLLVPALVDLLATGSGSLDLTERLMRAVADGRTAPALEVLRSCLTSPRRAIKGLAARTLAAADRTVDPGFLRQAVESEARRASRGLAALAVLDAMSRDGRSANATPSRTRSDAPGSASSRSTLEPLRRALHDELAGAAVDVSRFLGLAYGARITRAVVALRGASSSDRSLAIETLEVTIGPALARVAIPLIDPHRDEAALRQRLAGLPSGLPTDPGHWLREFAVDGEKHWQESWLRVCALYAAPEILGAAAAGFAQPWVDDDDPIVAETARWAQLAVPDVQWAHDLAMGKDDA